MKAFGVFEGGGVRGYAHLGALKACEDRTIQFIGVAGTSIGAIVATLVAAGFTSEDLYAVDGRGRETGLLAGDPVEAFFNPIEYNRLQSLSGKSRRSKAFNDRVRDNSTYTPLGRAIMRAWDACWAAYHRHLELAVISAPVHYVCAIFWWITHWRVLRRIWSRAGGLASNTFTTWLDDRLRERLGLADGKRATFADMPIPLSIIATNLSSGTMTVFCSNEHPDMPVAVAAMASASYPLVFDPVIVGSEAFVDGGLVSNFPAWTLDLDRAKEDVTVPTFGFRVTDASGPTQVLWPGDNPPRLVEAVRRIIGSAMAGRGDLETRMVGDLHPMEVRTEVKATDFHLILKERSRLYAMGRAEVLSYFREHLGPQDPEEMEQRLLRVVDIVARIASAQRETRAYIIQPVDSLYVRVIYAALYPGDADDTFSVRLDSRSQAMCLQRREPVLMRICDIDVAQRRSPATKYMHALRPENVTHVYCIPMFDDHSEWQKEDPARRAPPLAALCVDFVEADDHLLLDPTIEDRLATIASALVDLWKDRESIVLASPSLNEPEEVEQPAASDWTGLPEAPGYYVSARKVRNRVSDAERDETGNATR